MAESQNRTKSNKSAALRIIPLGGLGEIGKNTMAICYGDDIMLVDAGMAFPSEDMLGVDIVLPDISFLEENQDKLRGLAITHGHEDHIGGIPYILRRMTIPDIYGPALALGLLERKLAEFGLEDTTQLHRVQPRQEVKIGCFTVKFVRCTHSIADSYSLIIDTPIGTIIHTGDYKFDFTPVDGEQFDIASLTAAGDEGVLLLMSDSTNSMRDGYTPSERTIWRKLDEVFANARQRIIVTTFASNVHRVKQILQAAIKYDRKVTILGRSMLNLAGIARDLGYMSYPDGLILSVEDINNLPHDRVVILTTGSQGEPLSALTRIANNEHRQIKIIPGDTVIISATPIPGNERSVANTINALFMNGANVVYGREAGIHVSGHACREEQKLMLNICRPQFFMPIHGEYRMLVRHAELATECGVDADKAFVMNNGDVLEVYKDRAELVEPVKSGIILVDSSRAWEIDSKIIEERRQLSEDGAVTVTLTVDQNLKILAGPDISLRGLIFPRDMSPEEMLEKIKSAINQALEKMRKTKTDKDAQEFLKDSLSEFFNTFLNSHPLLHVIVQELKAAPDKSQSSTSTTTSSQ